MSIDYSHMVVYGFPINCQDSAVMAIIEDNLKNLHPEWDWSEGWQYELFEKGGTLSKDLGVTFAPYGSGMCGTNFLCVAAKSFFDEDCKCAGENVTLLDLKVPQEEHDRLVAAREILGLAGVPIWWYAASYSY